MKPLVKQIISQGLQPSFISFTSITRPQMRKKNNPFLGAQKITKHFGLINSDYLAAVNRNLPEGVNHVPGETWHAPILIDNYASCVAVDKETGRKYYLRFFPVRSKSVFTLDGKEVPTQEISPFLYKKPETWKPKFIVVSFDNIVEIKLRNIKKELTTGQDRLKKIIEKLQINY